MDEETGRVRSSSNQEEKEKQGSTDKRVRLTLIGIISVLALALIVSIVWIASGKTDSEEPTLQNSLPQQYQNGEPIAISSQGIGVTNPDAEDLYFYFDYTCSGCVSLDDKVGPLLTDASQTGDFNLLLQPVVTSGGPFNVAATTGAVMVAAEEPELFIPFQEALINFYLNTLSNPYSASASDSDIALETVSSLASQVGISDEVIAKFNLDLGQKYLDMSTQNWISQDIKKRDSFATPEFVYKGTKINFSGDDAMQVFESITKEMSILDN